METRKTEVLTDVEIDFSREEVLNSPPFSKWRKSRKVADKINESFEALKENFKDSIEAEAAYRIMRKEETDIEDFSPPKPALNSDFISFCAVTLREKLEREDDSTFSKFMIDAMENVVLNRASRTLAGKIRKMASEKGLNTTRVLSPGSGRIEGGIENLEFIFEHLDTEKIGVNLIKGCALRPEHSVSYILGIGSDIEQAEDLFTCEGCERWDCPYRS